MHQILFESDVVSGKPRAVGVAFKRGEGDLATLKTAKESGLVRARKEVILSAGAYNSPWLLVRAPANGVVWCGVCGVWCVVVYEWVYAWCVVYRMGCVCVGLSVRYVLCVVKWVGCGVCRCADAWLGVGVGGN
jgi:hypothetical protein